MLTISYSGSLDGFDPEINNFQNKGLKKWFWTFHNNNINPSTRSGFYLIKAVQKLVNDRQILPGELMVRMWGKINDLNKKQIKQFNLEEYFELEDYLPKSESIERLKSSDLLFLPLEKSNSQVHKTLFIPGKVFEYLNSGKPILALCETSDCRTILEKSGLGICTQPDDINLLSDLILRAIKDRTFISSFKPNLDYIMQFDFREKTKELANIFDEVYL